MKNRRKMRQKRSHGVSWSLIVATLACGLLVYGAIQGTLGVVNSWLSDLPSVEDSDAFNYARKTRVYASDDSTLLAEFFVENREPVSLEEVSSYVLEGTVATEDERFYEHNGVDPQGIARALLVNLQGGSLEGASTITQQFVRATLLAEEANEISIERKIREAQLATELEKLYTKDEILMLYLNTINYGDGCWGIEAASRNYFQKHANELTISEAATLVGIPQSPTYLNPKTNPDACVERRNLVLSRMLKYGTITQEEYDAARVEPLNLNPAPPRAIDGIYAYPYFTSYVRQILLENYSQAEIFKGGLSVYTTIDPNMQSMAESAAQTQYESMSDDLGVSMTVIDPSNGYIKAMIGGKDEFYQESQYNLATQAQRHAGSSFKPFTLIAAIEQGINPITKIDCTSPLYVGSDRFENYGGASYGIQTIQNATAISSNTGYIRLAQEVSPQAAYEVARRMGITSDDLKPLLSATLGAVGVSPLEMASAYSVLAANGVYREPVAITRILDYNGEVVHEHQDAPQRVLSEEVSYATTKVLQSVFSSGGTAAGARLWSGQPAAGKTGTSENWRDSWLCGYTPQLVCAAWIGNPDEERPMPEWLDCSNVWRNFMSMALEGQPIVDFPTKSDPPYNNKFNDSQKNLYDKVEEKKAPNVVGKTIEEATSALAGFKAEAIYIASDTVPAGYVISQESADDKVTLYVSTGPAPTPDPPPTPTPDPGPAPDPGPTPVEPSQPPTQGGSPPSG